MAKLYGHELALKMAELARSLAPPGRTEDVLAEVTSAAVELIPGADMAGVLLIGKGGQFQSLVGTSVLMPQIDELQHTHQEGPCLAAATSEEPVIVSNDLATDHRWPNFGSAAIKLGLRSSLSVKLYSSRQTAGALGVFGYQPAVFAAEDEETGLVLASHAAAAILASKYSENLRFAVASRDTIGQAKGIIMERFDVDAGRAFDLLRKLSQIENTPLAQIAQRVIDTRADKG